MSAPGSNLAKTKSLLLGIVAEARELKQAAGGWPVKPLTRCFTGPCPPAVLAPVAAGPWLKQEFIRVNPTKSD